MRIATYNINGIRAALTKGLAEWLATQDIDILCLQEVKALREQVDLAPFEALGYAHIHWHAAEKKGYSGVATLSKMAPEHVSADTGMGDYDREGRILRSDFGDWTLLNCYFPSGSSADARQAFKMQFLEDFLPWVERLRQERPRLIVVGDYNIAHTEQDIHDPKGNQKSSGFLPEERAWMDRWFGSGFVDAFRQARPAEVAYSWWSYRAGARSKNKGWRIDYQSLSPELLPHLRDAYHLPDALHSDHCPVLLELGFP